MEGNSATAPEAGGSADASNPVDLVSQVMLYMLFYLDIFF